MTPTVLIVEDNEKSLAQRVVIFQKRGMSVLAAASIDQARDMFAYSPSVDLIVCDYNLDVDDPDNSDGVKFAAEIRDSGFELPMVLYSGRDEVDLSDCIGDAGESGVQLSAEKPFNFKASRARMTGDAQDTWFLAAVAHKERKRKLSQSRIDKLVKKYDMPTADLSRIYEFVPGKSVMLGANTKNDLFEASGKETESNLRKLGFSVALISGYIMDSNGDKIIEIKKPFLIWQGRDSQGASIDVLGCPHIHVTAVDKDSALKNLALLLKDHHAKNSDDPIGLFALNHLS